MKFETISADEAQHLRKDVTNDAGVMAKGVPPQADIIKASRYDKEKRTARFVMSAEVPDRMGDIVVQEGLDLTNFEANPVGLLFHNSRSWPIGKWADVTKTLGGRPKRTEGSLILLNEGEDPDADRAAKHLAAGTMKTVSIGFRPDWKSCEVMREDDGRYIGMRFNKSELLECSVVPIPALPAAAMKELSTGMLSAESQELIKGILENFSLKDGKVFDREVLETAVREADGNRTYHVIGLKKGATDFTIQTPDGSPISADDQAAFDTAMKKVFGEKPAAPGEAAPVAPNPGDDETAKELAAQEAASADFEAHRKAVAEVDAIVREGGRADSFTTRILRAILPIRAKAEPAEPETPPAPTPVSEERRAAAMAQASELKEAGEKLVA